MSALPRPDSAPVALRDKPASVKLGLAFLPPLRCTLLALTAEIVRARVATTASPIANFRFIRTSSFPGVAGYGPRIAVSQAVRTGTLGRMRSVFVTSISQCEAVIFPLQRLRPVNGLPKRTLRTYASGRSMSR